MDDQVMMQEPIVKASISPPATAQHTIQIGKITPKPKKKPQKIKVTIQKDFKEDDFQKVNSKKLSAVSAHRQASNSDTLFSGTFGATTCAGTTTSAGLSAMGENVDTALDKLEKEFGFNTSSSESEYEYFEGYIEGFSMTGYVKHNNNNNNNNADAEMQSWSKSGVELFGDANRNNQDNQQVLNVQQAGRQNGVVFMDISREMLYA